VAAADAVVDLLFEWFVALEAAVAQERERSAGKPVPMPILGLWAVDFAVQLLHTLGCYPNLPLRHVLPFAACVSTTPPFAATQPGAPVPIERAAGLVLPLGELLAAAGRGGGGSEAAAAARKLARHVERMAGLAASCGDEFGAALRALPSVAAVLAGALQLWGGARGGGAPPAEGQEVARAAVQLASGRVAPALKVEALLALQQAALRPGLPPAPPKRVAAAFVRAIGGELTDVLLGKGGLMAVVSACYGDGSGERAVEAVGAVAGLVGDHRRHLKPAYAEHYYREVCGQLLPLLRSGQADDSGGGGGQGQARVAHAAAWRGVAARIGSELIRTAPAQPDPAGGGGGCGGALAERYLLRPLLGPAIAGLSGLAPAVAVPAGAVLAAEAELAAGLRDAAELLVGSGPSEAVLLALRPTLRFWFRLASYCEQSARISAVRRPAGDFGRAYLKFSEAGPPTTAALLAMLGLDDADQVEGEGDRSVDAEYTEYTFRPGSGGGIEVVARVTAAVAEGSGAGEGEAGEDVDVRRYGNMLAQVEEMSAELDWLVALLQEAGGRGAGEEVEPGEGGTLATGLFVALLRLYFDQANTAALEPAPQDDDDGGLAVAAVEEFGWRGRRKQRRDGQQLRLGVLLDGLGSKLGVEQLLGADGAGGATTTGLAQILPLVELMLDQCQPRVALEPPGGGEYGPL
jgi:hypothetical protein